MPSDHRILIDLAAMAKSGSTAGFSLDDAFFGALDQDELTGGQIVVEAGVRQKYSDVYEVRCHIEGEVRTPCDRCLEDVTYPVCLVETLKVFPEGEAPADDDMARECAGRNPMLDLAWDVYEAIVLSLPMQRVHNAGDCGDSVPDIYLRESDDDDDDMDDMDDMDDADDMTDDPDDMTDNEADDEA